MKPFSELIVVAVTAYSGTSTPDKNGRYAVMLQCIAGRMPNRNVMSGTVAERAGIEVGKTYLMQVREAGIDKVFGPDYQFVKIREITQAEDIVKATKLLSSPEVFEVKRPEGYENAYQRKGDAVEGNRTKRIKEGNYEPAGVNTSAEHTTAPEIIQGTSTDAANPGLDDLIKGNAVTETNISNRVEQK